MDQTEARRLARECSTTTGDIYTAMTRDAMNGYWERTYEWGVFTPTGEFISELPALKEVQ